MHEERNLEVVKGIYAAFGRGDLPGVIDALAEDVEWRWYGPSSTPFEGSWDGRAGATECRAPRYAPARRSDLEGGT